MAVLGKRIALNIVPGVSPLEDSTALDTVLFTNADKVRFQNGKLRKMNGWERIFPSNFQDISGFARNIFSYRDSNGDSVTIIGTNTRLYAYYPDYGDYFYNITPLQTSTNAIPDSLSTEYNPSVTVGIETVLNSPVITLYINQYFQDGDLIQISGVTGGPYNGIPASAFNGTFPVKVLSSGAIVITLSSMASSTGYTSAVMTWAASYIYVDYASNGLFEGDRIKISGSTDVDGILAATINAEHIISRIINPNEFVFSTSTFATSSVTAGGGSGVLIQLPLPAGNATGGVGYGFGGGVFGGGPFGGSQPTDKNPITEIYPRIWSMDNIDANLVLTPGDPETNTTDNLYIWQNDIDIAPVLVSSLSGASNVPLANKWIYVSNNAVITLGSAGTSNQYVGSDFVSAANPLPINWSPGAATYAYSTILAQAVPLVTQSKCRNYDLLFTKDEVYRVEFVDKPDIWFFSKLFSTDGIVGPKARTIIEDTVFWMGAGDFYVYDGYTVNVLPNNTVKRYVYDNINWGQSWKCFAFSNVEYSEVWFFYPAGDDEECNNYVIYNYKEWHWTIGTCSRTACEERINTLIKPLLIQSNGTTSLSISNNISTFFIAAPNDPISVANGSNVVSIEFVTTCFLQVGDFINIAGSTDVGGILAADINGAHEITSVQNEVGFGRGAFGSGLFGGDVGDTSVLVTFIAATSGTSNEVGGGDSVTIGTPILGINYPNSGLAVGDIIQITGATSVDGISAEAVNTTNPIRAIENNVIQVAVDVPDTFSTSQATGGGTNATLNFVSGCFLFQHEVGLNDYNNNFVPGTDPWDSQFIPLNSYAQTNYVQFEEGDNTTLIYSVFPDVNLQESMYLTVNVKEFALDPYTFSNTFPITSQTRKVDPMMIGRVRQYVIGSNVIDSNFVIGRFNEEITSSTPR